MMSRLLRAGVLAGGLLAAGAGVAHADETTGGPGHLLAGNQVLAPLTVPITAHGDALDVLGLAGHHHAGHHSRAGHRARPAPVKAAAHHHHGAGATAPTNVPMVRPPRHGGLASGNQVVVPVMVPVTFGGDAIALLGRTDALGHSGAGAGSGSAASGPPQPAARTTTGDGVGSGNQVLIPVCAPVNANGDAVSVLGGASGSGGSVGCGTPSTASVAPADPSGPSVPIALTAPTGPGGTTTPSTPVAGTTGATQATPGAGVLGLHLVASAADAAPTTGSLAMTGARPLPLVAAGIVLVITGVLLWRGRHPSRERDF